MKKLLIFLAIVLLGTGFYQYFRPLALLQAVTTASFPQPGPAASLPWPNYGQAAIAAQGYGLLATRGEQKPAPMASIAKVVTALAVLQQKPLAGGQQGPNITILSQDLAIYNSYYSQGGSVVKVENGEQISEYQALQALLIPSANNIADSLVNWAFGSVDTYVTYANKMLQGLSLQSTKIADASGFSNGSVSNAQDLVTLGEKALSNPVIAEIVNQSSANLPVAGTVNNVNWLLGSDGVIGIKTGNTDEAGGCYLFASRRVISGQNIIVVGAVMGAPDRNQAITDSRTVLRSVDNDFENVIVVRKDQIVGYYQTPWGAKAEIIAKENLNFLSWRGVTLEFDKNINSVKAPLAAGQPVGKITVSAGPRSKNVAVVLKDNLASPSWHWRLFR